MHVARKKNTAASREVEDSHKVQAATTLPYGAHKLYDPSKRIRRGRK